MYRELTREEKTLLNRFFDKWGVFDHFKDKHFLVKENHSREVFLVNEEVKRLALEHQPALAGMKMGELKKQFWFSIEGASLLAKHSNCRKIMVDEHAEALVLYGRDVFGDSIIGHTNDYDENQVVLITNTHGEVIGIGRARLHAEKIKRTGVTVTNIADRGVYLREEDSSSY
ncbi:MAG: PUA domain-containing protein [Nitrososphaerales archaeon]